MTGRMGRDKSGMVAFDLARIILRWHDDFLILIGALFHRQFEGAHRFGATVKLVGMAQGHEVRLMIADPAKADSFAGMPRRELIAHEHGGRHEFRLLVQQEQQVERRGK